MEIVIYGAGKTAKKAYTFIGHGRIKCFAVSEEKNDSVLYGKNIIFYEEMLEYYKNNEQCYIVVASDAYFIEMESKLKKDNVLRYIVFHEVHIDMQNSIWPYVDIYGKRIWRTYTEILSNVNLKAYKKIGIYGDNVFICYLILEIKTQTPDSQIYIISDTIGESYLGCERVLLDEIANMDCMIINQKHCCDNIRCDYATELEKVKVIDLYSIDSYERLFYYENLKKYKNIHKGKRGFIVATGPSLKIEDLDMLHKHNEICISVNKIYRCYDRTQWRADYVGLSDPKVVSDLISDKTRGVELPEKIFIGDNCLHCENKGIIDGCEYFHLNLEDFEPNRPRFSADMSIEAYRGCTVTYDFALQMAAYMGFSEIYLIGVDHSMEGNISAKHNHFIDNYFSENERNENHFNPSNWEGATLAYEAAEAYSRKNEFRIYNATRGGKLGVFERVDFDKLFER